jgi:hypothetical protein
MWRRVRELALVGHARRGVGVSEVLRSGGELLVFHRRGAWRQRCSRGGVLVHTGAGGQCHPVTWHPHQRRTSRGVFGAASWYIPGLMKQRDVVQPGDVAPISRPHVGTCTAWAAGWAVGVDGRG